MKLYREVIAINRNITKTIAVLCILSTILGGIACKDTRGNAINNNTDNEASTDNETQALEVPTADMDLDNMVKETADFKKVGDYWKREVLFDKIYHQAAPVWEGERADVYDIKDMLIEGTASDSVIYKNMSSINQPKGTKNASQILGSKFVICEWLQPDYVLAELENPESELQKIYCEAAYNCLLADNKITVRKNDMDCITVALYEDWCDYRQKLTFKFYGVTEEQFNMYIKDGHFDYLSISNDCKTGKRTFDKLVEEEITQTGKYYVDYNDIQGEKEYKYILFIVETDCDSSKYAFCVTAMPYDIDKNAVEKYNQWKEKNKEMFLGQK